MSDRICELLDAIRPSDSCSKGFPCTIGNYCPPYVGPLYDQRSPRVLFVGLDPGSFGKDEETEKRWRACASSAEQLRNCILSVYAEKSELFNAHYRGCVRVAATLLGMVCSCGCQKNCSRQPRENCVLSYFAQTNAVKCNEGTGGMAFKSSQLRLIRPCMEANLLSELKLLQPDYIVLQGRNNATGHIHMDFCRLLGAAPDELVRVIQVPGGKQAVLIALLHPSARGKFSLSVTWEPKVLPMLQRAKEIYAGLREGREVP